MYFIIGIIIVFYIVWLWSSTKGFENVTVRVSYMFIGTLFLTILCLIIFQISKIGVTYPKNEMIGQDRKIVLLIFVPLNGFVILTQCAAIMIQIKSGMVAKEKIDKKLITLAIIFTIMIVIQFFYYKKIQYGIIDIINNRL